MTIPQAILDDVDESVASIELAPTHQRVSPRAAMPGVPKRPGAEEGQRHAGYWGQLCDGLARAAGRQRETRFRDRVTIDSIRNHCVRHFPVQNVAQTTYRAILEWRAKENSVDFIKGVATAITPMAFYETVMVKGYETLVDSDTKVDVSTGMIAAVRLQALIDSRAGQPDTAHIMAQVTHIIEAVRCRGNCGVRSCGSWIS